jgi:hypothetical protein
MPYAPNTIGIVWHSPHDQQQLATTPAPKSTRPEKQRGHRESSAPVVDGVVRVMRAVAA